VTFSPCLVRSSTATGERRYAVGDPLVDSYLAFVAGRARPNTLRAVGHDLKTFLSIIGKNPAEVVAADVFDFLAHQRGGRVRGFGAPARLRPLSRDAVADVGDRG
jgi:integrase/recombinase XerD